MSASFQASAVAASGAPRIYRVAILAMGGEGGGVLADWLVHMAEEAGYDAQTTSVPGVAQRTGATIYYVEFVARDQAGRSPVLSLMPVPGEVDLVVASELMEAGRALQRGLVTRERTTLISSTHRVFSMTEKTDMGDGRIDSGQLLAACEARAARFIGADFAALASSKGSVVSASLFGAMAACGVLPFERSHYEHAIESSGIGVRNSLAAFAGGFDTALAQAAGAGHAAGTDAASLVASGTSGRRGVAAQVGPRLAFLAERINALPSSARATLVAGIIKLCEYQDEAYAAEYVQSAEACWQALAPHESIFEPLMRGLALWMSYEDIARVADLKTRSARFSRIAGELSVQAGQVLEIREYLHPRIEELADSLPQALGRFILGSPATQSLLKPFVGEGRVVNTSSLRGFLLLRLMAGLSRWRRASLRQVAERAQWQAWVQDVLSLAASNPALARSLAEAQRLIKGYSDTQQRGRQNFKTIMSAAAALRSDPQGAGVLDSLCKAALADEQGQALQARLASHNLQGL